MRSKMWNVLWLKWILNLSQSMKKRYGPQRGNLKSPVPVASAYGAIHGALAVTLALYAREEMGRGDVIEVPLAGATMSAMGAVFRHVENPPARYRGRYDRQLNQSIRMLREQMKQTDDEAERQQLLRQMSHILPPLFDNYETSDGRWVHMLAVANS